MTAASEIQQVTDDVVFWQAYEPEVKADLCSCAVRGANGWVIIDPIPLTRFALGELNDLIEPVAVVLTNGNHTRAAGEFRERCGVSILAHREASSELEISADEELEDGRLVAGNLSVIAISGGGAGEIALHSPGKSLHIGDALINLDPYGFSFLPDKYCRDALEMKRSLGKLAVLDFSVMTFAHGLPLVSQAKTRLSQLLA